MEVDLWGEHTTDKPSVWAWLLQGLRSWGIISHTRNGLHPLGFERLTVFSCWWQKASPSPQQNTLNNRPNYHKKKLVDRGMFKWAMAFLVFSGVNYHDQGLCGQSDAIYRIFQIVKGQGYISKQWNPLRWGQERWTFCWIKVKSL